jgi:hypothetical protein
MEDRLCVVLGTQKKYVAARRARTRALLARVTTQEGNQRVI